MYRKKNNKSHSNLDSFYLNSSKVDVRICLSRLKYRHKHKNYRQI